MTVFLYTWDAAYISCPIGWNLPTKEDFDTLIYHFGIDKKIVSHALIEGGISGFEVSLCGMMWVSPHRFSGYGNSGHFWTSTKKKEDYYYFVLYEENYRFYHEPKTYGKYGYPWAKSVRCIKD